MTSFCGRHNSGQRTLDINTTFENLLTLAFIIITVYCITKYNMIRYDLINKLSIPTPGGGGGTHINDQCRYVPRQIPPF